MWLRASPPFHSSHSLHSIHQGNKDLESFIHTQIKMATWTCCFCNYQWEGKNLLLSHLLIASKETFKEIKRGLPSFKSSEQSPAAQSLFDECNSVSETIRHQSIRMTASVYVYSNGVQIHILWDTELLEILELNSSFGHSTLYTTFAVKHRYWNSVVHKVKTGWWLQLKHRNGHFNAALVCSAKHVHKALMVSIWMIQWLPKHIKGEKQRESLK